MKTKQNLSLVLGWVTKHIVNVKYGYFSEGQLRALLKTLTAKASLSYDGLHGWYTEWPRIREIDGGRRLMTMHGMLWLFPREFTAERACGIRPLSSILKVIGDFCFWRNRVVFGCDDAAITGGNRLCGQSQSNLWFVEPDRLDSFGSKTAVGGVWLNEPITGGVPSEPFLAAGFSRRWIHLWHDDPAPLRFTLEKDESGEGEWITLERITVPGKGYVPHAIDPSLKAEWIRVKTDRSVEKASVYFHFSTRERRSSEAAHLFDALPRPSTRKAYSVGLIRPRGGDLHTLHMASTTIDSEGRAVEEGYYELDADMKLKRVNDLRAHRWLKEKAKISGPDYATDDASVIVTDRRGRKWRLPKGDPAFDRPFPFGWTRGVREVVTERYLFNGHGTLYELPRRNSHDVAGIRPVATHNRIIADMCSWRGLLVLSGVLVEARGPHVLRSDDGRAALWVGAVDDLWRLGKPRGTGGPWLRTPVRAGAPSDPYLIFGYDRKSVSLSHDLAETVTFTIQVDPTARGDWVKYGRFPVGPGETRVHKFERGYSAHWVRVLCDRSCRATAIFKYE